MASSLPANEMADMRSRIKEDPGKAMAPKLGSGDVFPRLKLQLTDGRTLELPDGLKGKYNVILFYRGHW
jgi:hypothetical protein